MRFLLVALLCAISYAQTVEEQIGGTKKYDELTEKTIALDESTSIRLESRLGSGDYGAVFIGEVVGGGNKVAFKVDGRPLEKVEKELEILKLLHAKGVTSTPRPELDGKMYQFPHPDFPGTTLCGFGMELFSDYETLGSWIGRNNLNTWKGKSIPLAKIEWTQSMEAARAFNACIDALSKLWEVGVTHNDNHMDNEMYNGIECKVIDVGLANYWPQTCENNGAPCQGDNTESLRSEIIQNIDKFAGLFRNVAVGTNGMDDAGANQAAFDRMKENLLSDKLKTFMVESYINKWKQRPREPATNAIMQSPDTNSRVSVSAAFTNTAADICTCVGWDTWVELSFTSILVACFSSALTFFFMRKKNDEFPALHPLLSSRV